MLDFNNLPTWTKTNRQVFTGTSTFMTTGGSPYTNVYTWTKPRGATFIHFFVIGAGGGGGAGLRGDVNAAGGGGGGGSGSVATTLFLASMVPDVLYLQIGRGGLGGDGTNPATDGDGSAVAIIPEYRNAVNCLVAAGGGKLGNAGTTTTANGGSGASAGAGASNIGDAFGVRGYVNSVFAGQAGGTGGGPGTAGGSSVTPPATGLLTGGCGGGGFAAAINSAGGPGGNMVAVGATPGVWPGTPSAAGGTLAGTPGQAGSNGLRVRSDLMYFLGGSGGGGAGCAAVANTGLAGGDGGNGAYGCGGGGGGGGFTGSSGGRGGNGGPGLIIVTTW